MLASCSDHAGPSGGRAVGAGTLGGRLARSALCGDADVRAAPGAGPACSRAAARTPLFGCEWGARQSGVLYGTFTLLSCGGREGERVAVASASWLFVLAPRKDQNNG